LLDLREKLDEGILVGDGVIGTLLADRGVAHPYSVREKLADLNRDDAPKYGIEMAQRLLVEAKPVVGLDAVSGGDVVEAVS
jgi:methionine synthase I (cobalamin-dependent)